MLKQLVKSIGPIKIYKTNGDIYPYYAVYDLGMDCESNYFFTLRDAEQWATIH